MNYHEQIINRHGCVCRPEPEIARLKSLVESLRWANAEKDLIIKAAAAEIAELRRQLGRV